VLLKSFEIVDKLAASDFNKLLHLYSCATLPRQSNANMFSLKCVNLRPDGGRGPIAEETNLSVSLQPLRLNIDQDTLLFIVDFFSALFPSLSTLNPPQPSSSLAASPASAASALDDDLRGMTIRYSRNSEAVEIQPQEVGVEAFEDDLGGDLEGDEDNAGDEAGDPNRTPSMERSGSPAQSCSQSSGIDFVNIFFRKVSGQILS
jgi:autophagy-related protein 2